MRARCLRAGLVLALAAAVAAPAGDAVAQADPAKTLRVVFPIAETGFDPQASSDLYSNHINRAIFEPLYQYDYVARPYRIVPRVAAEMPQISADGLTWTIRIKPGIYYADDPAFKGTRRELVAADFVYGWKRVLDPKMRSPTLQTFDNKFVGAAELVAAAKADGKFDYDAPMEGLRAIDRYTLRLRLLRPSYDLIADLTSIESSPMAREVVEAYGDGNGWAMANPVGTGPYRLKEWKRGQKVVLEANPTFREVYYPESSDPADRALMAQMKGKRLPRIGRIEVSIVEESNPRLLAFESGDFDYMALPGDLIPKALDARNQLLPPFAQAGVRHFRAIQPSITYYFFNMEDPVVGGYGRENVALRRAISMAWNSDEEIRILRQNQGVVATQPIPPNVTGHDPTLNGHVKFDPAGARALLDRFGYVDRDKDGWREQPDGKPLVIQIGSPPDGQSRISDELWQRSLAAVGIKAEFLKQKWPDLLKMARAGQLQMWGLGNTSTTTEGYGFLGLLYGGHAGLSNLARFKLPEFDRLYDQSRALPDSPERTKLFRRMSELVTAYAPWMLNVYRYENVVVYPWVQGYKHNVFQAHPWTFLDIDTKVARKPVKQ